MLIYVVEESFVDTEEQWLELERFPRTLLADNKGKSLEAELLTSKSSPSL